VGAVTKSTKRKPKTKGRARGGLGAAKLAEMIEEATVDAYPRERMGADAQ
jgi:hypothetical protein